MRKAIEESKRSVHSTRIDTVLGDPMPIKPQSVLPISYLSRPVVEDPEYLPDTVAELAASLSALARAVPPDLTREIYTAVRDIIDRIAPITQTSLGMLDALHEAVSPEERTKSIESAADTLIKSIRGKIRHYNTIGTPLAVEKIRELEEFLRTLRTDLGRLSRIETNISSTEEKSGDLWKTSDGNKQRDLSDLAKLRDILLSRLEKLTNLQDVTLSGARMLGDSDAEITTTQGTPNPTGVLKEVIARSAAMSEENLLQIYTAFETRIRELLATGDAFDRSVAEAVGARRRVVYPLIGVEDSGSSGDSSVLRRFSPPRMSEKGQTQFDKRLYTAITTDSGDLSNFSVSATGTTDRFTLFLQPRFEPGSIQVQLVPEGEIVRYDAEGTSLTPIVGVNVYRRYLQTFDGRRVEVRPDVRIDFDEIREEFIQSATHDMRMRSEPDAAARAADFYDLHRVYIVRDAINPEKFKESARKETARIANQRLSEFEEIVRDRRSSPSAAALDQLIRKEAADYIRDGLTEDEARARLARSHGRVAQDEILRILRSVELEQGSRDQVLKSEVKKAARSLMKSGDPARVRMVLQEDAKVSFSAIAEGDTAAMSERGIEDARGKGGVPVGWDATADRAIAESLGVAVRASESVPDELAGTLLQSARGSLARIAGRRRQILFDSVENVELSNPRFTQDDAYSSVASAAAKMRLALKGVEAAAAGGGKAATLSEAPVKTMLRKKSGEQPIDVSTLASVAREYARISRLLPDNLTDDQEVDKELSSIFTSVAGSAFSEATSQFSRVGSGDYAKLTASFRASALLPIVTRIVADLTRDNSISAKSDIDDLIESALLKYGLEETRRDTPVFAEGALKDRIQTPILRQRRAIVKYNVADTLLGAPGAAKTALADIENAASLALAADGAKRVASMIFDAALLGPKSSFASGSSSLQMVRSIVNIACRTLLLQRAEGLQAVSQYLDALSDIMHVGLRAPSLQLSKHYGTTRGVTRAVSVDRRERGVGYFVDTAGNSVARVVAAPDIIGSTRPDLDFLDPTLEEQYDNAINEITRDVGASLNTTDQKYGAQEAHEAIVEEARDMLLQAMQEAAAEINLRFGAAVGKQDFTKDVEKFVSQQNKIIESPQTTRFAKAVAIAANKYAVINRKVPTEFVPYYTRVSDTTGVDPDTGERVLKTEQDVVKRSLPLSAQIPVIDDEPSDVTNTFLQKVLRLVDLHVLTDIEDPVGTAKQFKLTNKDFKAKVREPTRADRKRARELGIDIDAWIEGEDTGFGDVGERPSQEEILAKHLTAIGPAPLGVGVGARQMVGDAQILAFVDVVRPGASFEDFAKIEAEARSFVVTMMFSPKTSGYLVPGVERNVANLNAAIANPEDFLNETALSILESVGDHISEEFKRAGVKFISLGEKRITQTDLDNAAVLRARARIIERLGREKFRTIGLADPVALPHDPVTGLPVAPPVPSKFFRDNLGHFRTELARARDPIGYVAALARINEEYRKLLRGFGVSGAKGKQAADVVQQLSTEFPSVLERARQISMERVKRESAVPELTRATPINVSRGTESEGIRIQGLSSPPTPSETARLVAPVSEAYKRILDQTRGTDFLDASRNEMRDLAEEVKQLLEIQEFFERRSREGAGSGGQPMLLPRAFVERYSKSVAGINQIVTKVETIVANRLNLVASKFYSEDMQIACEGEIKALSQRAASGDTDAGKKLERLSEMRDQILTSTKSAGDAAASKRRAKGKNVDVNVPTAGHMAVAEVLIGEANSDFKETMQQIAVARKSASRIADKIARNADKQIEHLVRRARARLRAEGRSIDSRAVIIVDTPADLETLRTARIQDRKRQLAATFSAEIAADVDLDQTALDELQTKIETAASSYVDGILARTLFGVRTGGPDVVQAGDE
jgi:hypothetical protein